MDSLAPDWEIATEKKYGIFSCSDLTNMSLGGLETNMNILVAKSGNRLTGFVGLAVARYE